MLFIRYDGVAIMVSVSSLNPTRFHVSLVQAFAKSPRSVITDYYFKFPTPPNRTGHAPIRLSNLSGIYTHIAIQDKVSTSPSNGLLTLIRRGSFLRVLLYHVFAIETTSCLCTFKTSACLVHPSLAFINKRKKGW